MFSKTVVRLSKNRLLITTIIDNNYRAHYTKNVDPPFI